MRKVLLASTFMMSFCLQNIAQQDTSEPIVYLDIQTEKENTLEEENLGFVAFESINQNVAFIKVMKKIYTEQFHLDDIVESFYIPYDNRYGIFQVTIELNKAFPLVVSVKNSKGQVIAVNKSEDAVTTYSSFFKINDQPRGTYYIQMNIDNVIIMQRFILIQ